MPAIADELPNAVQAHLAADDVAEQASILADADRGQVRTCGCGIGAGIQSVRRSGRIAVTAAV
jgi:hypothetical protein